MTHRGVLLRATRTILSPFDRSSLRLPDRAHQQSDDPNRVRRRELATSLLAGSGCMLTLSGPSRKYDHVLGVRFWS